MCKRAREGVQDGCRAFPRILAVRAYVSKPPEGDGQQGADCHDVASTHWINGTRLCKKQAWCLADQHSCGPTG